jgi:hypothetical protein
VTRTVFQEERDAGGFKLRKLKETGEGHLKFSARQKINTGYLHFNEFLE